MVVSSCNLLEDNVYDLGEDERFVFKENDTLVFLSSDETIYSFEGEETADSLVKTIWFTHKYGIVRYEYNNGEVFELLLE